jgi:hypothetical protein
LAAPFHLWDSAELSQPAKWIVANWVDGVKKESTALSDLCTFWRLLQ